MGIEFEISEMIPAKPEIIYAAWVNSEKHSMMTGGSAQVSANIGESFTAWDGYIQGKNIELDPPHRILQHWRTSEFDDDETDSLLEILFEPKGEATKVTIRHSALPEHGLQYQQGWVDAYFVPMKAFFGGT